ncbi:MAG: cytochrome C, partial [Saprospiraceae bacterium]|nr:cytochrome C [Saprospiraceae bacterium]
GNHWHITKPIAFDDQGKMYIPFGSPSNACQDLTYSPGGKPGIQGMDPCPELEHHGGIWQFDAGKINLTQRDGIRFTTGVRSVVGLTFNNTTKKLYGMMHGRDNLFMLFPDRFDQWQSAVLPAEELLEIREGADYGWPYCYYDHMLEKNVLAPEYGGDGAVTGRCDSCDLPLMGFPGHWAPNDLLFYDGNQFPDRYKRGAFIAFHGSTNRTPYPQAGYFVCFVPFTQGRPNGEWEVFADGFAQVDTIISTSDAVFRPMGLATGPDGSLYITDSNKGRIWRISYHGDAAKFSNTKLAAMEARKSLPHLRTPDPLRDILPQNRGSGIAMNYLTYCAPCHQRDGLGAEGRFPPLTDPEWIINDKQRLIQTVLYGLTGDIKVAGETYNSVMPGFAYLEDTVIADILSYIRQSFGNNGEPVASEEVQIARSQPKAL